MPGPSVIDADRHSRGDAHSATIRQAVVGPTSRAWLLAVLAIAAPVWADTCLEIEFGLGYIGNDDFRYGRYVWSDGGLYGILDVLLCRAVESVDARHWSLRVRNAGLDSRYLAASIGTQGRYRIDIEAERWPMPGSTDARTPLRGIGGGHLTLPADWTAATTTVDMSDLLPSLQDLEFRRSRRRRSVGISFELPERWSVETRYHQETKQGLRSFAGVIGNAGGNARAIALPEPVDQRTRLFDAALRYVGMRLQLRFGFHASLFDNAWSGLTWQNPFAVVDGWDVSAGYPGGFGRAQLMPDNRFHQLSVSAGYDRTPRARLNADVAMGRMRQDQAFLPYTINPALAASVVQPLPRGSLDGLIDTTLINLRMASRPNTRWRWTFGYRYDERNNRTPRDAYIGIGGDSEEQDADAESGSRRYNLPVGYREQMLAFEAGYRASRRFEVAFGAERR